MSLGSLPKAVQQIIHRRGGEVQAECARLSQCLKKHTEKYEQAFMTAPSPGIIASAMKNEFYPSADAYVAALAAALAVEYKAIVDAGFVLQIDAPDLAMERHFSYQNQPLGKFISFIDMVIEAINRALESVPREMVRLHVCWGNYAGPHHLDVPLGAILPSLRRANVGALLISMANPRHAHEGLHSFCWVLCLLSVRVALS